MCDKDEIIFRLEAENAALRQRVTQFEMLHAISAASVASHASISTLEKERELCGEGLQPLKYKRDARISYNDLPTFPTRPHFDMAPKHPSTEVVIFDGCPNDPYHPSSTPIYQTSTFVQPDVCVFGPYDYSRSGNPTRTALETLTARLEGAHAAFAFASGMAALQTLITTLNAGDIVLASADLYGGMHRLLSQVTSRLGVIVTFVPMWDLEEVKSQMNSQVKLLHIESPTNPLMRIVNIRALCDIAHEYGALVSIDNTMMSPVRCNPLSLGCDYIIHSATKFLCGHSDTTCGVLCVKSPELAKRIGFLQNAQGNALGPFDSWLMLRGIKTICLRVDKQELNAVAVALFLSRQDHFVRRIHYAGLNPDSCPTVCSLSPKDFELHRSQTVGPGSVLSFETGDVKRSHRFVRHCKIFKLTVSFGSCNSLVEMPCLLSHASIPRDKRTLPEDLIRLSIGIEQIEDILADLSSAIDLAVKGADDDTPTTSNSSSDPTSSPLSAFSN